MVKAQCAMRLRQQLISEREASNRKLGLAGDKFALEFERFQMKKAAREDFISEIE